MTKTRENRHEFVVAASGDGERLDKYLSGIIAGTSRNRLKNLIESGHVCVGGQTITEAAYRVKPAQVLAVTMPAEPSPARPVAQAIDLNVVYEDADLIVIDKPAGLVVHPATGNPDGTLVNALIAHCGESLSGIGGERRPGIVHRLDKDTSGLIVAAKNDRAHAGLARRFETRDLERAYLAIVWGVPAPLAGRVTGNIGRSPRNRKKMAVLSRGGRAAETGYRVIERLAGGALSLVECRLKTGRTHQIRVHMAHIGHPVLGDPLYGSGRRASRRALPPALREKAASLGRQALHARLLAFTHPVSAEPLHFESPLPADMEEVLEAANAPAGAEKSP